MKTTRFVLGNGLKIIVRESRTAPVVSMAVWVGVGSADETPKEAGLAHVHEHMLFKGTKNRGVGEIAREIEASGGSINAFTSFDQTVYYTTLSSRFFEAGIDILCDAIRHSTFDADELERELEVILEEIKRGEDQPARQAMEETFALSYQAHPYAKPVIGTRESVAALTRDDVLSFYKRWYVPKNMVVTVVGDVDAEEARAAVEARLGDMPDTPAPNRVRDEEPSQTAMRVGLHTDTGREVHTSMAFHVPGAGHEDAAVFDILRLILSYGDSSLLIARLERELEWVNDVSAGAYMPKDPGLFLINCDHMPGPDHPGVEALIEATLEVVGGLGRKLVSGEAVMRTRTLLESSQVHQRQTMEGQSMLLGSYETTAGGFEYEETYFQQLRAVTPERLREVVARIFVPENLSVVVYGPEEAVSDLDKDAIKAAATRGLQKVASAPAGLKRDRFGMVRVPIEGGPVLIIQEDPAVELVSVRVAFLGGQRSEMPGQEGIGHLVGGLWTRGTQSRTVVDIAREIESMGSGLHAYSGRNSMGVQLDVLSHHLSRGIGLMADCLAQPRFDEELLRIEKRLVAEALQARLDNLGAVGSSLFRRTIFSGHSYGEELMGREETIKDITRDDIIAYYRRCARPDQMVISVVGDVVAEEVVEVMAERFGPGAAFLGGPIGDGVQESRPMAPLDGPHFVAAELDKKQAMAILGYRGLNVQDPDRYAVDILTAVLSGQGGRLFVELRDKQSLAYSVYARAMLGVDRGFFALNIATSPEKIDKAVRGLETQAQRLCQELITPQELTRAQTYLIGHHDIQLQSYSSRASQASLDELYGLGYTAHREFPELLLNVTPEDVQAAAQRLFTPQNAVLAVVCPKVSELPDFGDLGFPEPKHEEAR